ncbi:MAG: 5-methyltetrahydropteroyltriglutamate--homocysteine S-methyltransferase [Spirochaetes bacterium]|nr:5-methyltetrahydropteroyltriglutamate--homocysteine S-methyltransferase [Spirochaetota bacterium]
MKEKTLITGFPRMGENRELKKALEDYWSGKTGIDELQKISSELRKKHWMIQKDNGISLISCNDFSFYDSMLDTAVMINAVPERFRDSKNKTDMYFSMAHGDANSAAMEMTKWFNTNYHYIVPELDDSIEFKADASKIVSEYREALSVGIHPKINIIGPITFLALSKTDDGSDPLKYIDKVTEVYCSILRELSALDETVFIQFDEPVFVRDLPEEYFERLREVYLKFSAVSDNIRIIFTTYFEHSCEAVKALADVPLWGLGLDFVHGKKNIDALKYAQNKIIIAGVVDGRNIWINDFNKSIRLLKEIAAHTGMDRILVSTCCSLLHVPFSSVNEPDSRIKDWFSFAVEKTAEVSLLGRVFHSPEVNESDSRNLVENAMINELMKSSEFRTDASVQEGINEAVKSEREGGFTERQTIQRKKFNLPVLPLTTIGSFPQTPELRKTRRDFRMKNISSAEYESAVKNYIDDCIAFQEEAGLDVFVHGEPERTDMVEYFGEMLKGFHFTKNGWVQSYGSRCVKPPVIYGDVSRPEPMTVKWISYAQGKTKKIVKGMLTGPVTILNWSFVRDDKTRAEVSKQIALALRDEIDDLQKAGISIIQVDEAAFKEGYPLRRENIPAYEEMAVSDFKLACSRAEKDTQIHTHMCYSNFNDIMPVIDSMDADVITIETARSGNKLLKVFRDYGYKKDVGPGVYDIHSARIPDVEEIEKQIRLRMEVLPAGQLWVNPDCGLKTRKWDEVKPALENMVKAVEKIRMDLK